LRLRYTLPALADLEAILDYIDRQSPQGAARVQARIQAIIDLLLLHPLVGTRTDDPATAAWRRRLTPILFSTKRRTTSLLFMPSATLRVTRHPCRSDE
jgi:plasmid stabilization system protein ParE